MRSRFAADIALVQNCYDNSRDMSSASSSASASASSGVGSSEKYDYVFKFIIIGDTGAGKSCILHQFVEGKCEGSITFVIVCVIVCVCVCVIVIV